MTLEQLVEEFTQSVIATTEAVFRSDPDAANQHEERYSQAFQELRARGDPGRDALAVLLKHPRPDVRCAAAAYLLRHRTTEAKAVLESLGHQDGMSALAAQMVLSRWKIGTWSMDPV